MITRKLLVQRSLFLLALSSSLNSANPGVLGRLTFPFRVTRNFARTLITSEHDGSSGGHDVIPGVDGGDALGGQETASGEPAPHPGPYTRAEEYENFKQQQNTASKLGGIPGNVYRPHILVNHPPPPRDITLELLMAAGAHLGHTTALWNPGNARYIFGVRDGIHIISLDVAAAHLRRAAKVVSGVARAGGSIVFVGTRPGQERCVINAAKLSGGAHVFDWWIAGTITNAHSLLANKKAVEKDMQDRVVSKKPVDDGRVVIPDLVVVLNPMENSVALHECAVAGVPTVGIVDTDMDPLRVTYPIPCNDDSLRAVQLVAGILGRAGEEGRLARIREAQREAMMSSPPSMVEAPLEGYD